VIASRYGVSWITRYGCSVELGGRRACPRVTVWFHFDCIEWRSEWNHCE